jgi:DNA-directed RNA polymerase subunit N (RpoN/RPB10)
MLQNLAENHNEVCVSACKSIPMKRVATFLGMFLFCCRRMTFAQSKGAGGFQKAITEVSSYQTPVSNLMKAIAAVIALVGAFPSISRCKMATKMSRRLSC